MAGPDLSGARRAIEAMMDDTARIDRDSGGRERDLDEATGALLPDAPDGQVWTGPCLIGQAQRQADGRVDVHASTPGQAIPADYAALIPLDAAPVRPGDVLTVLTSRRDAQLPGRRFLVTDPGKVGTFAVARGIALEEV